MRSKLNGGEVEKEKNTTNGYVQKRDFGAPDACVRAMSGFWTLQVWPEQTGTLWATMGHYGRHEVDFRSVSESVQNGSGSGDLASSHRVIVSDCKTSSKSSLSDEDSNYGFFESK